MAHWTREFDIAAAIPDEVLLSGSAPRIRARRVPAPRQKVLRQGPKCREAFGARELRAHLPHCRQRAAAQANPNPNRMAGKRTSREEQKRRIPAIGRAFPFETGSPPSAKRRSQSGKLTAMLTRDMKDLIRTLNDSPS